MQFRLGSTAVLLSVLVASVSAVAAQHIAEVNPERTPAGAETIDLGDVTLLPGLMDMHTHLTGDLEGNWVVKRGMSPIEAIRSATIHAADLLGVTDRGRLKAGLLVDVIAVPGNPLEEIRAMEEVVFVMKDGNVYKRPGD